MRKLLYYLLNDNLYIEWATDRGNVEDAFKYFKNVEVAGHAHYDRNTSSFYLYNNFRGKQKKIIKAIEKGNVGVLENDSKYAKYNFYVSDSDVLSEALKETKRVIKL